jgi:hypothetical protein
VRRFSAPRWAESAWCDCDELAGASAHATVDLNIAIDVRPRISAESRPIQFDVDTIKRGLNFTLTTEAADLDARGHATVVVPTRR